MILAVVRAKGSWGTTTTALVLASVWPSGPERVMAEVDPSGGDVAARFELAVTPGMLSLIAEGRPPSMASLGRHCQFLPGGLPVLVAPASQAEAQTVVADAPRLYAGFRRADDALLVADCGWVAATAVPATVSRADMVAVVVRQVARSAPASVGVIDHARELVAGLHGAGVDAVAIMVGDRPYPPAEVEGAVGAPVIGVVDDDPLGAAWLAGRPAPRQGASQRSRLVRSGAAIADRLARRLAVERAGGSDTPQPVVAAPVNGPGGA